MKYGTVIDHKHTYKYCRKHIYVNNYKGGDGAKLEVISDKFNLESILVGTIHRN